MSEHVCKSGSPGDAWRKIAGALVEIRYEMLTEIERLQARWQEHASCKCPPDREPGTYEEGCPFHEMAKNAARYWEVDVPGLRAEVERLGRKAEAIFEEKQKAVDAWHAVSGEVVRLRDAVRRHRRDKTNIVPGRIGEIDRDLWAALNEEEDPDG